MPDHLAASHRFRPIESFSVLDKAVFRCDNIKIPPTKKLKMTDGLAVDFGAMPLESVADPTNAQDAATMAYVDAQVIAAVGGSYVQKAGGIVGGTMTGQLYIENGGGLAISGGGDIFVVAGDIDVTENSSTIKSGVSTLSSNGVNPNATAIFSHEDHTTLANSGFRQNASGDANINTPTGQDTTFSVNNTVQHVIKGNKMAINGAAVGTESLTVTGSCEITGTVSAEALKNTSAVRRIDLNVYDGIEVVNSGAAGAGVFIGPCESGGHPGLGNSTFANQADNYALLLKGTGYTVLNCNSTGAIEFRSGGTAIGGIFKNKKMRIGSGVNPTAELDVTGDVKVSGDLIMTSSGTLDLNAGVIDQTGAARVQYTNDISGTSLVKTVQLSGALPAGTTKTITPTSYSSNIVSVRGYAERTDGARDYLGQSTDANYDISYMLNASGALVFNYGASHAGASTYVFFMEYI